MLDYKHYEVLESEPGVYPTFKKGDIIRVNQNTKFELFIDVTALNVKRSCSAIGTLKDELLNDFINDTSRCKLIEDPSDYPLVLEDIKNIKEKGLNYKEER